MMLVASIVLGTLVALAAFGLIVYRIAQWAIRTAELEFEYEQALAKDREAAIVQALRPIAMAVSDIEDATARGEAIHVEIKDLIRIRSLYEGISGKRIGRAADVIPLGTRRTRDN